jgi:hypothetical protein
LNLKNGLLTPPLSSFRERGKNGAVRGGVRFVRNRIDEVAGTFAA